MSISGTISTRRFEIYPTGDPYSRAWDCAEYTHSFDDATCIHRGDISGRYSKASLTMYLRRNYRGCIIRVSDFVGVPRERKRKVHA